MSISALFIRRPVMTTLVMAGILLFGLVSYHNLAVSDLPTVDYPTVAVNASLPGASPETMASSVATPLEKQFSTIAGIDAMTSQSALGSTSITLQFSLDRNIDLPSAPLVQVNHRQSAMLATQHLLAQGHRAIVHITGPMGLRVSRERLAGYLGALARAGVKPDRRLRITGDFTEEGGYRDIERLLAESVPFTAVFAANDLSAIGVIAALKRNGHRVPEDVSVVGFDDIHLAAYTSPPLTTIQQPTYEMGRRATEILIDAIEHGRRKARSGNTVFEGKLIIRGSTQPLAGT